MILEKNPDGTCTAIMQDTDSKKAYLEWVYSEYQKLIIHILPKDTNIWDQHFPQQFIDFAKKYPLQGTKHIADSVHFHLQANDSEKSKLFDEKLDGYINKTLTDLGATIAYLEKNDKHQKPLALPVPDIGFIRQKEIEMLDGKTNNEEKTQISDNMMNMLDSLSKQMQDKRKDYTNDNSISIA